MNAASRAPSRRALFLVITDYPGGAERVAFNLAGELASRPGWKVEVKIVCSQLPDSFSKRVLPANVSVHYGPSRNWYLAFATLPFRLLFQRYDFVFATHVYTNALVSMMRRSRLLRSGRLVLRESTSVFDRFVGLKARRFRLLYRAYGAEDVVIAQTRYMADHVSAWLPKRSAARIRVLPNPLNVAALKRGASESIEPQLRERLTGRRNILFCGRLTEVKKPQTALEAFRIAAGDIGSAQLVFMGAGPLEAELRQRALKDGLADRVVFLGQRSDPYAVMASCDYGLLTSEREGFPNVVLEMMASGMKKIIVTPCAGDLDQLAGVAVTATRNAEDVAAALRSAIDAGEDCGELYKMAAQERAVDFYMDELMAPRKMSKGVQMLATDGVR